MAPQAGKEKDSYQFSIVVCILDRLSSYGPHVYYTKIASPHSWNHREREATQEGDSKQE